MKITVFIPTYNSGHLLRATLDSVTAQSHRDLEVLVVDDSSTDGGLTAAIVSEYAARDSRISFISKPHDGDVPHAWHYVMPRISGEFVLYMSHDDIIAPDAIERGVAVAMSDESIDHVVLRMTMFNNDYRHPEPEYENLNRRFHALASLKPISGEDAFVRSLDYGITGFGLWRTSLIQRYPVPVDTFNGDDFMHRVWRLHCRKVAFSDGDFFYRQSPTGILRGHLLYHFRGLKIHDRLAMMLDDFKPISDERYAEVIYNWYKWLRQHNAWFSRHRRDYTPDERKAIVEILRRSHTVIGSRITSVPPGFIGRIVRLSSRNFTLFCLLSFIDKPS